MTHTMFVQCDYKPRPKITPKVSRAAQVPLKLQYAWSPIVEKINSLVGLLLR